MDTKVTSFRIKKDHYKWRPRLPPATDYVIITDSIQLPSYFFLYVCFLSLFWVFSAYFTLISNMYLLYFTSLTIHSMYELYEQY